MHAQELHVSAHLACPPKSGNVRTADLHRVTCMQTECYRPLSVTNLFQFNHLHCFLLASFIADVKY